MLANLILIISSVFLNAIAQIFLKTGMTSLSPINFNGSILKTTQSIILNPYNLLGFISYGLSIIIWLWVLYKVDVSFAYPFQALGYILVTFLAWMLFNEEINMLKIIALTFISLGLIILALSARTP
ncbi:MAG: 4-amino-4-deoxy-L-arabinose-phosphoundecaprenol flippase subunit ArnE [Alphaproteobacteria bacterium MarineAlpha9_Bin2]|nr:MAG: 4-amino-4-deoxy-L-arabinose-phosphoundecaprenol flippase subunit ArnE [Alphaproteobacteria bacterium MarineAlpha9_Bin2]